MEKRWYCFADESRTKITGSSASRQDASNGPQEELDESDPRVQEFLGPEWARARTQEFTVDSVEELTRVFSLINVSPRPGWRGQAVADWPLLTELERDRDKTVVKE